MAISSCLGVLWLAWQGEGCLSSVNFGFSRQTPGWGALSSFSCAVGTAGTWPSRAGPYFFEEIGERTPRGRRFLPLGTLFSGARNGEGSWLDADLACGLQNQRLMARPPARAGGRSGLLTGGKSGKPNGYSLLSPKGHLPTPPARPAGGRAVTGPSNVRAAGQVTSEKYNFPHTTPPEKGVQREEPLPSGVLSPISSQEMGPRPGRPRFPAVPTS